MKKPSLVVRQPKIALVEVGRGAREQGSRGEICTSSFPLAPPHLCLPPRKVTLADY
ncbi:hypothetical protein [Nostoc sp.]|uniref:hypothetical protein n=1 Tax=Nostoc sp. TaxID=1180 RepID=UPI002FFB203B